MYHKGKKDWKSVLSEFWDDFNDSVESTVKLSNTSVYDYINEAMKDYLFPSFKGKKTMNLNYVQNVKNLICLLK